MAKINDNGGMIGKTLDFNSTGTYTTGSSSKKNSGIWSLGAAVKYSAPLYSFTSHTFTTAGSTGNTGPLLSALTSAYSSTTWASNTEYFDLGEYGGFQKWTVPETGSYEFQVFGASGGAHNYWDPIRGTNYGYAAKVVRTLSLTEGDKIQIVVGQRGEAAGTYFNIVGNSGEGDRAGPGGGGASWVFINSTDSQPLIVAGGGAGFSANQYVNSKASLTTSGYDAENGSGAGGTGGNGAGSNATGGSYWAAGGAGWLTDGTGGNQTTANLASAGSQGSFGGLSPRHSGQGGPRGNDGTDSGGNGGFGGGGGGYSDNAGTGGGGGYSGGAGSNGTTTAMGQSSGGGGGSYDAGLGTITQRTTHGDGYVIVTKV